MDMLKISNWEKWQTFRSDRAQPPWIKIHRQIMRNIEWVELSDARRGQLVAIWLLAADREGEIPDNKALIKKLCFMEKEPDLDFFIEQGFILPRQSDANMTPDGRQSDHLEESRVEVCESREGDMTPSRQCPYQQIVDLYHKRLPMLPKVARLTDGRKTNMRARWNDELPTLQEWDDYFAYIAKSKFLTGRANTQPGRTPFTPNIDWFLSPTNLLKIEEKKYHG